MTAIILGVVGMFAILAGFYLRDAATVATAVRVFYLKRPNVIAALDQVTRHLRQPPSRWAGA